MLGEQLVLGADVVRDADVREARAVVGRRRLARRRRQASCLACSAPSSNLIVALLGEQLFRAALRCSQIAGFLRRLGSDRAVVPERAREEAAAVGIALAEACWPVVLAPGVGTLKPADLEAIDREARRLAPGPHGRRAGLRGAAHARVRAGARVRARLVRLSADGGRAEPACSVTRARQYALAGLLRDGVAPAHAQALVDDLLRVLEAALDRSRQDVAAQRCFMHRNTFRHRLHKALEILGDDLEDAEMRLAVHVALKLHRAR